MTGFGKAEQLIGDRKISVEIKALNSKQLDLTLRLPSELRSIEYDIRLLVSNAISRGKADVSINMDSGATRQMSRIDADLAFSYKKQIVELSDKLGLKTPDDLLGTILKLPGLFNGEESEVSEEEKLAVVGLVNEALEQFSRFRIQEGNALQNDLQARIHVIVDLMNQIMPFEEQRKQTIRQRLTKNLLENIEKESLDENRFEQELLYYLEKMDVTEERIRLGQHCGYFLETLKEEGTGKKLGFIAQEIGREINTLGSKANDANIQRYVVQMKDELEKIKEQLFNIL